MKLTLTAILACTLAICAGCATVQANNPGQKVLDIYRQYTEAAEGAAAYGKLPSCDTNPGTVLCSDRDLVQQIKVVRDNTEPVVKSAKAAVLDPNFNGTTAQRWTVIAQNALDALNAIAGHLPKAP
jgi:hypothetical protein